MIKLIQKITIFLALFMIVFICYHAFYKDSAVKWKNFEEPKLAAFTSLEQDEAILKELHRQTQFGSYKELDPVFFVKPSIFQTIERR